MGINDTVTAEATGVADGGDLIVDGSIAGIGAAQIIELGGTGSADIYREIDPDGDGTYEISQVIDTTTGTWHSQENELRVSSDDSVRLRINNTSGGTVDFFAIGLEVDS